MQQVSHELVSARQARDMKAGERGTHTHLQQATLAQLSQQTNFILQCIRELGEASLAGGNSSGLGGWMTMEGWGEV